ncbi:MAG: hypothetical protein N3D17_07415 [bacterium]|nr:hypothetical protein [bacterium]
MRWRKIIWVVCLLCTGYLFGNEQISLEPSFYASFEDSVSPVIAKGSKDIPKKFIWQFTEGKKGKGLLVRTDGSAPPVYYWAEANAKPEKGTICFWFKPDWSNEEDTGEEYRQFLTIGTDGGTTFLFYWQRQYRAIYFATGGVDPQDSQWKWNYSPGGASPFLKKGEWIHMAVVWDKEKNYKAIYVNGQLLAEVKEGLGVLLGKEAFHANYIILGGRSNTERIAPGVYDELVIYPEALTGEDIQKVFKGIQQISIQEKKTAHLTPLLIEVGKPSPPEGVVVPDEVFSCEVPIKNLLDREFEVEIKYLLLDYYGVKKEEKTHHLSLKARESLKDIVSFSVKDFGPYKIRAEYEAEIGGEKRRFGKDVITFGCVPEDLPKRGPKPDSFFGHHPHMFGSTRNLDTCKKIGVKWVRCLDMIQSTWWLYVEPSKGNFEFRLEKDIDLAADRNMNILGVFMWTPRWAARVPDDWPEDNIYYRAYPPKDWNDYRNYVQKTVQHYKDRIKYWEAWNEPLHTGCWRGTTEEYVKLLKITYETCKEVDPECKVLGLGGTSSTARKWNEEVLSLGALKYMDIFDVHPIFDLELRPERAQAQVEEFYELMDKYGERKPIWFTESGLQSTTFFSDLEIPQLPPIDQRTPPLNYREAAEQLVKIYCSWMSRGVQKHFFYYMREMSIEPHRAYVDYGMAEITGVPKPMGFSYAAMAWLLEDMKWKIEWQRTNEKSIFIPYDWKTSKLKTTGVPKDLLMRGHIFEGKDKTIAVIWAEPKCKVLLSLPSKIEIRNLFGNPKSPVKTDKNRISIEIGEEPCYFILKEDNFKALCKILEEAEIKVVTLPEYTAEKDETFETPGTSHIDNFLISQEALYYQWKPLDLKPFANMGFADDSAGDGKGGWTDEGPNNDLRTMPVGKQKFYGVPFEIVDPMKNNGKAIIVLKSKNSPLLPDAVRNIPVNSKARAVYFLHSSAWTRNEPFAKYVVKYEDGTYIEIPIIGGKNIADWWTAPLKEEESKPVPIRVEPVLVKNPWRYIRVFEWLNPYQEKVIKSIDFVSEEKLTIPILIGITVYTL